MKKIWSFALLFAAMIVVGCDTKSDTTVTSKKDDKAVTKNVVAKNDEKKAEDSHDHSGWWCNEHGVKESECSMCNSKVAKAFQDKGDWCKEHSRAKSQCFICDPKLKDKFAAEYKAKYGEAPPEPVGQKPEEKKPEVKKPEEKKK